MTRAQWEKKKPEELKLQLSKDDLYIHPKIAEQLPNRDNMLDFGCGTSRNLKFLKSFAKQIDAYDLPQIIEYVKEQPDQPDFATDNWDELKYIQYDFIMACLVFQHMGVEELISRLQDMKRMTKRLFVISRWYMDVVPKSVRKIIIAQGWKPLAIIGDITEKDQEHWHGVFRPIGPSIFA